MNVKHDAAIHVHYIMADFFVISLHVYTYAAIHVAICLDINPIQLIRVAVAAQLHY